MWWACVLRHELMWIGVAQLIERETAALGDAQRFCEQIVRIDRRKRLAAAQVAFAVGEQSPASFRQRGVVTDRGQRVLQRSTSADMHMDITRGDQRQPMPMAERTQYGQSLCIIFGAVKFDGDPQPIWGNRLRSQ